ncbi:transposase [Paenibacillus sp. V4I7]|nr:transposase [Paenibacillus sp. V4I7]
MKFKSQYKQNQLIENITVNHLVVGVDIAQETHVARAVNFVLVNPYLVKKNKENRGNTRSRSDKKDALVIADMVKNGYYSPVRFHSAEYEELRS